ncbi:arginyl-tRNA synthetase [Halobacillus karajensis]|uniref:Arginine--tRNA ligase n=1 Tax=Halobacillus karajensis TaxID=195088 RepID=A0A024P5T1_9BACI|nr:arginine--tRNA ligase [Halobacillus karajensis]CDQ20510.1 Arginine--tRNA ligase [Halobacillus karajensis]CDQ24021.1 Arginine--tRNA ligase [Halobacillus karajensis]CDQ27499.1 Arginine--tRNA ligase [Halobacillus karajensis]SEH90664.1 arginyl-tRNA synthetase [Halobacillus karajensis]
MEKQILALQIAHILGEEYPRNWVLNVIEIPKQESHGDLAFPCFPLAKTLRKNPNLIAEEIAQQIKHPVFHKVKPMGGYVNVFLDQTFVANHMLQQIFQDPAAYGSHEFGKGKSIVLDMSAPNIAKPFSMGHLRSTVIGNALANLAKKCGYETVKINYIGDYGTQFGKLLAAYLKWGNEEQLKENPIQELTRVYVEFHKAAEVDPSLIEEGRSWFKKLEDNDEEAVTLWKWFKDVSLSEFEKIYDLLGIEFDLTRGEAYYNNKMEGTIGLLKEKGLLEESEGAQIIRLDEEGLPPCLIRKSNGTTIYATRDLTAAIDRQRTYNFEEVLYVVGQEQTLHFQQVKQVLKKAGFQWAENLKHISFGMMLQDGKKMSTRQGKTVLLEQALEEAIKQAAKNIEEKNPYLEDRHTVAQQVGVGAVIFHDLKHDRRNDVEFSLEEMLTFEGHTAPYLQYAHARTTSLLEKGNFNPEEAVTSIQSESAWPVIKTLRLFPEIIEKAFKEYDPSKMAKHLLELAKNFNRFYAHTKIIGSDESQELLTLIYAVKLQLKEGLSLLGIEAPDHM